MKNFKWPIIGVLVIIIVLIVLLLVIPNEKEKEKKSNEIVEQQKVENNISEEEQKQINTPPEFSEKAGYREYYTVINCISKYLNLQDTSKTVLFIPVDVVRKTPTQIDTYLVSGVIANLNVEYIEDAYFMVALDIANKTFLVKTIESNEDINNNDIKSIEPTQNNKFEYQEFDLEYNYKQIFKNMKRLMLAKPEIAYQYLDEKYKKQRFGNYENFEQYVKNNRERLLKSEAAKYKVNDEQNLLTIRDQDRNGYQFNITGVMEYTAKIDNYIFPFEDDIDRYKNEFTEEKKVEYNIQRWFKMLANKEYKYAYSVLDEEFRTDKFGNVEEFANYISKIYNENNNISIRKLTQNGNLFVIEITISVEDDEFMNKYMNIILKLEDEIDFTMSFEVE